MDLLEYIVRIRGGAAAAAEVRGIRTEVRGLAADQAKLNATTTAEATAAQQAAAAKRRNAAAMTLVTTGAKVGALAIAGMTFEAVKFSNTFDTEMLRVRTQAGASSAELHFMRGAVLDLAKSGDALGASPTSLAMGLYHLESLGIRGAAALHALTLAAQASEISGASLEETTSALGAALFVGIKGAGGMDHVMALLNATVGQGNMRMGELVHSLGTGVLSSAKVAGLSIEDVMSALALFADAGQDASGAAAQFATALHFLYNPSAKAQAALDEIGLDATALAQDLRKPNGMITALQDLRDHLDGLSKVRQEQILGDILPGGRGRILLTELTMLDRAEMKWRQINKQASGPAFRDAVEAQRRNPATQLHIAWSKFEADLIDFGHVVGPIVVPILKLLIGGFGLLVSIFAKIPEIPLVLFIALLTIGIGALVRVTVGGLVGLARYAFGLETVATASVTATTEIEAQTVATVELAAAQDAAAASSVGLVGRLGGLAAGLVGIMRFAGPVGAFLYGLGVFNPDEAGLSPAVEQARLAGIDARYRRHHHGHDPTGIGGHWVGGKVGGIQRLSASSMRFYEQYPSALAQDLHGGSGPGTLGGGSHSPGLTIARDQAAQLRRYFERHHIKPPPLLAMGAIARTAGAAIVGDQGPEMLDLPAGAVVSPLRGGPGGFAGFRDIVLKVEGREMARVTRAEILAAQARGG